MEEINFNQYIREIELKDEEIINYKEYPFSLPIIKKLNTLKMHPKVTFIVGENGSGKSTLLEAIAIAYGFNPEGGTKNFNFSTCDSHSSLYDYIKIVKGIKMPKNGFFLRAESMYNLASNIDELGEGIIDSYGGKSLHKQSHGESFFAVMMNRFSGNGLYILDEPESALSPSRQMSMISRINELVKDNCQFIISTHSPILMSYPDAIIYEIKEGNLSKEKLEDTEHFQITKSFLNNKDKFLDILMS